MLIRVDMRIAIPYWQGRVSPVLDVAGVLLLVDVRPAGETGRRMEDMRDESVFKRAARIHELGVNTLICGAISRRLDLALASAGIEVIPEICGDVDQVLAAFFAGQLEHGGYLMPGCRGRQRRFRRGRCGGRGRR